MDGDTADLGCVTELEWTANIPLSIKTLSSHSSSPHQRLSRVTCGQPYVTSLSGHCSTDDATGWIENGSAPGKQPSQN